VGIVQPIKITNVLTEEQTKDLIDSFKDLVTPLHDESRSRYISYSNYIEDIGKKLEPLARIIFKQNNIKSSYSVYCKYFGKASMNMHKDDNACTYTIDLCIRQNEPWGLWVDGQEYILNPNEALCYMGNDQLHGRQPKDLGSDGSVEMIFFHYVQPDHWFFTRNK
jgi:hypothetical protein